MIKNHIHFFNSGNFFESIYHWQIRVAVPVQRIAWSGPNGAIKTWLNFGNVDGFTALLDGATITQFLLLNFLSEKEMKIPFNIGDFNAVVDVQNVHQFNEISGMCRRDHNVNGAIQTAWHRPEIVDIAFLNVQLVQHIQSDFVLSLNFEYLIPGN